MSHRMHVAIVIGAMLWSSVGFGQRQPTLPAASSARSPLPAVGPYRDPDLAARPMRSANALDTRQTTQLGAELAGTPDNVAALSSRAWLLAQQGERARALADIDAALALSADRLMLHRQVLWGAGWVALALGDGALANDYWDRNLALVDSRPFWVPYSRATAFAMAGDLGTAVNWYARAAADMPQRWGNERGMRQYTRHWQPAERRAIDAAFAAWSQQQAAATSR